MRWIEPIETAKERARFWNQPRITAPVMLYCTVGFAVLFSVLSIVAILVVTGSWSGLTVALCFAGLGGLVGVFVSFSERVGIVRQEIELRTNDFSVRHDRECSMRFDELRGYSIVGPTVEAVTYRVLMLYPRGGRAFSIGIARSITDDQIHAVLGGLVPFVTIIDDVALNVDD